ncbi:MAG: hypothetical protein AMXMBFR82_38200 [Candidatus Hydrogenedentota bacterium]
MRLTDVKKAQAALTRALQDVGGIYVRRTVDALSSFLPAFQNGVFHTAPAAS